MIQKNNQINSLETHYHALNEAQHLFSSGNKNRWIVTLIISIFGFLYSVFSHEISFAHLFISFLLSAAIGCWIFLLSQFFSWMLFLRRCQKNKFGTHVTMEIPLIKDAFKKAKQSLLKFSLSISFLLFSFFLLLAQRPYEDGTARILSLGHIILLLFLSLFLSLMVLILITVFVGFVLRIVLFPKNNKQIPSAHSPMFFGDNYPYHNDQQLDPEVLISLHKLVKIGIMTL